MIVSPLPVTTLGLFLLSCSIFRRFFMALINSTSLSCENMVNYDGVRTNQQNTMIARHFAALMLISCTLSYCGEKTISQIIICSTDEKY